MLAEEHVEEEADMGEEEEEDEDKEKVEGMVAYEDEDEVHVENEEEQGVLKVEEVETVVEQEFFVFGTS